jgi:hypothetical protein
MRAQTVKTEELSVRLRGSALETRRRLRPVAAPVQRLFAWAAPYISRSLLLIVQLIAALIALILEVGQLVIRRIASSLGVGEVAVGSWLQRHVTPRSTVAFVGAAAAVLLGVAQFTNYHGVAVDAPYYAGSVGQTAPAPLTGLATAGSAHLWVLVPVAAIALLAVPGAYRGDPRFAAAIAVCGVLGVAVALAIDLPQGLKAGREGLAFYGAEPQLLGGFWVGIMASATLILCGCLLPLYARSSTARMRRRRARGSVSRRPAGRQDVGGISQGLQTES